MSEQSPNSYEHPYARYLAYERDIVDGAHEIADQNGVTEQRRASLIREARYGAALDFINGRVISVEDAADHLGTDPDELATAADYFKDVQTANPPEHS